MIEDSKSKELQKDYLDILDSIIKKIQIKAQNREPKDVHIHVGSRKVYEATAGQEPVRNLLTPETVNKISLALSDPKSYQGSVTIKIGSEKVFHVADGQLKVDKLGLAESGIQLDKAKPQERVYSVEALQKQVEVLQQKLQSQQKLIDSVAQAQNQQTPETLAKLSAQVEEMSQSLEKQQKLIEKTQEALSKFEQRPAQSQNTKLQNWIGKIESKIKDTVQEWSEKVKDAITPETTKLRNQIQDLKTQLHQQIESLKSSVRAQADSLQANVKSAVNDVKQNIDEGLGSIKTEIQNTRQELTKSINNAKSQAIDQSVKALLKHLGTKNPDGSLSYSSKSFDFQQCGDSLVVKAKNGLPVLQDGALSADVSPEQIQALDKVQPIVDKLDAAEQLEQLSYSDSESQTQSRGLGR